MGLVGIVANPESGKDIRRIVSNAIGIDNQQKLNIIKRMLVALTSSGVDQVMIMPEVFGFGDRAIEAFRKDPQVLNAIQLVDMPIFHSPRDTETAVRRMREAGADCIVVLGGDGTCRLAAKESGEIPLLPISSGTNNVVPDFVEGTVAGLAAAYVALHAGKDVQKENLCWRHKRLIVKVNGEEVDHALVDAAVVDTDFVGSKAVWDAELIKQVFVTRANPTSIGISSVVGMARAVDPKAPQGAYVTTNGYKNKVFSTIVPGKLIPVGYDEIITMDPGQSFPIVDIRPVTIALDGERQVVVYKGDEVQIELDANGPWMVDVQGTLLHALNQGTYVKYEGDTE